MTDSLPLMTERDLELRLGLSRRRCYELISQGKIRSHRIGKSLRISEEQLQAFLASTESGPR